MEKKPEIFKPIRSYEGFYEVSSWGRVRSLAKEWSVGRKGETILRARHKDGEYDFVVLCVDRIKKYASVHVLVAEHFCNKPEKYEVVNHLDSDIYNNYYENLEFTTHSGNAIHGFKYGNRTALRGEAHGRSVLTKEIVLEIRRLSANGESASNLSRSYGISLAQASRIINRLRWAHI